MDGASGRVLIMDDEPSLLRMMSVYLERLGYSVTRAANAAEAWAKVEAAAGDLDLVVLDCTVPGLSVEELALRILKSISSVRIIGASGYPVDMTALAAVAPGRVMFLQKPFSPEALAAAVRRMLGGQEEAV